MAGFWGGAAEGLDTGVQLGVRAQERAEARKEREKMRAEDRMRWEIEEGRRAEKFGWEAEDREKKSQYEKAEKSFNAARALYDAGEKTGDQEQMRLSAKLLADTYNKHWVNGDETRIIFRSDAASPEMAEKWDTDEKLKGKDVAILSKSGGIMPFNNLKDAFKFAGANMSMDNFTKDWRQAEAKIAELNLAASQSPIRDANGKLWVRTFTMGPGGMPTAGPNAEYTGVVPETKGQESLREAETVLGRKPTDEERRVKAGVSKAESPAERIYASKTASGLLGGGGGGSKSKKDALAIEKAEDAIAANHLKNLLLPFALGGDPKTSLGDALAIARKVEKGEKLNKYEKGLKEDALRVKRHYQTMLDRTEGAGGRGDVGAASKSPGVVKMIRDKNGNIVQLKGRE